MFCYLSFVAIFEMQDAVFLFVCLFLNQIQSGPMDNNLVLEFQEGFKKNSPEKHIIGVSTNNLLCVVVREKIHFLLKLFVFMFYLKGM